MLDDLSRTIDPINGLKKLTIDGFEDEVNTLADWPFSQLLFKSPDLEELTIAWLTTTPANTSQLVEFIADVVTNSNCLHKLHIEGTNSTAEDGAKLMQVLADGNIDWLRHLAIT